MFGTPTVLASPALRCFRRGAAQVIQHHCAGMVASVAQENIFCGADAKTDAKFVTGAKASAVNRRKGDASPRYFGFSVLRRCDFFAPPWCGFYCVACVTCANR